MNRVTLKGLVRRKLRAVLTAVAIVLGVAMISGTFVLTDTIQAAFSTVFNQAYKNSDAVITGKSAIGSQNVRRRCADRAICRHRCLPRCCPASRAFPRSRPPQEEWLTPHSWLATAAR